MYGWPMNNYWTTNFNADQHGGHTWTYTLTSRKENTLQDATRFGWANRTPFLSRVLPGGGKGDKVWQKSFISGWGENILLVSAIPAQDGKSAIFHVRETGGKTSTLSLKNEFTGAGLKCTEVDVTGTELENGNLELNPFASKFFRVGF
jgi:alpha-mannosidase